MSKEEEEREKRGTRKQSKTLAGVLLKLKVAALAS